ncbi:AI-2E family transporter [Desertivirga brevis]|uniref:AI-2E family transporter n=1 Tax=Desertivirga brevis TaxID=2810310 RepID=UPI001A96AA38|nr:AI-2E family transporter [Pedobacter sp. SYSU D00873]
MLNKAVKVLLLFSLIFAGLYYAKPFLFPFTLAAIIAMLLLPLCKRIEGKGFSRPVSAIFGLLVLAGVLAGIVALLIWQMSDIAKDFSEMQGKVSDMIHQVQRFIQAKLGITAQEQKKLLQSSGSSGGSMSKVVSNTLGFAVDFILVVVYIFIFLISRSHLKKFLLKIVPDDKRLMAEKVVFDTTLVSYKYLSGLTMMIIMLWILYGIGFSIAGIKNAIFFAILCGILEIIPFVGNLTGTALTVLMALTQGGGAGLVVGVIITYFVVQFVQSYIIEPLVVGAEVNINPLFTIIALVLGELVWGIAGLVVAIPLLGMLKIVCDNIEELKPYGYLIGEEKKKQSGSQPWMEKVKKIFSKKG